MPGRTFDDAEELFLRVAELKPTAWVTGELSDRIRREADRISRVLVRRALSSSYDLDGLRQGSVVIFQAVSLSTTSPAKKTVIRLGVDRVTLTLNRRVDSPFCS
jgi:hypothetical protein